MTEELCGIISLQPGTWNVQIGLPPGWDEVRIRFWFEEGQDGDGIALDASKLDGLDSVLVEWVNPRVIPVRVNYGINPVLPGGAGSLGG